jgi:hypothetical protein
MTYTAAELLAIERWITWLLTTEAQRRLAEARAQTAILAEHAEDTQEEEADDGRT